jgi:hypothetical protein
MLRPFSERIRLTIIMSLRLRGGEEPSASAPAK